jgi:acetyltransferase-like isoleucine patch superfamily enzyme
MRERLARAINGWCPQPSDPGFEVELAKSLRTTYGLAELSELYVRFASQDSQFDALMRRVIWRASTRKFGHGVQVGKDVRFGHIETFEIGSGVTIGAHSIINGRLLGRISIGDHAWIGPSASFDVGDLRLEDYVGWGAGSRVVTSQVGSEWSVPVTTDERRSIPPVIVGRGADIGSDVTVLAGVTIGAESVVRAGALVVEDVPPRGIVAGTPAELCAYREDLSPRSSHVEDEVRDLRASLVDSRWKFLQGV